MRGVVILDFIVRPVPWELHRRSVDQHEIAPPRHGMGPDGRSLRHAFFQRAHNTQRVPDDVGAIRILQHTSFIVRAVECVPERREIRLHIHPTDVLRAGARCAPIQHQDVSRVVRRPSFDFTEWRLDFQGRRRGARANAMGIDQPRGGIERRALRERAIQAAVCHGTRTLVHAAIDVRRDAPVSRAIVQNEGTLRREIDARAVFAAIPTIAVAAGASSKLDDVSFQRHGEIQLKVAIQELVCFKQIIEFGDGGVQIIVLHALIVW